MGFHRFFRNTAVLATLLGAATGGANAMAQDATCPLPGQKPALVVQMFFGQSIRERGPVTKKEWNAFLRNTVTPRFPDGLTVYDGYGQWQDPQTHVIAREKSKVILIVTADAAPVRQNIADISDAYRNLFRQQSVAILTNSACVAF